MGAAETFIRPGKAQITGDQIAPGAIDLQHLSPGLFAEFRQIALHPHTGVKSVRIKLSDLEGAFNKTGFYMYGTNGTRYNITIVAGVLTVTAA